MTKANNQANPAHNYSASLHCYEDQCDHEVAFYADDLSAAKKQALVELTDWIESSDWGHEGASVRASYTLFETGNDDPIYERDAEIEIDPNHEYLIRDAVSRHELDQLCGTDPDDHDWTSDGEGGCRENPGVWATGGTSMTFKSHCRKCGLHRTEHATGSQKNPGEHDTVKYRLMSEDEIELHRKNRSMDPAE